MKITSARSFCHRTQLGYPVQALSSSKPTQDLRQPTHHAPVCGYSYLPVNESRKYMCSQHTQKLRGVVPLGAAEVLLSLKPSVRTEKARRVGALLFHRPIPLSPIPSSQSYPPERNSHKLITQHKAYVPISGEHLLLTTHPNTLTPPPLFLMIYTSKHPPTDLFPIATCNYYPVVI